MRLAPAMLLLVFCLGGIEGFAYWWMHPAPTGLDEPVLVYRPENRRQRAAGSDQEGTTATPLGPSSDQQSTIDNHQSSISPLSSSLSPPNSQLSPSFTTIPLPEIYAKSAPMLRCSSGMVNYAKFSETSGIYLAFFEWNGTDTGSVLEAFRHIPESCMGSIGMILVSNEKPIEYRVGDETLLFEHTIFREPSQGGGAPLGSPLIHAFRAVWVAGLRNPRGIEGLHGTDHDPLRTIRLKSAFNRFRPAHARVIQGAVRGILNADLAWQAFEDAMLKDLRMEK